LLADDSSLRRWNLHLQVLRLGEAGEETTEEHYRRYLSVTHDE
jgi:hypothetical protein